MAPQEEEGEQPAAASVEPTEQDVNGGDDDMPIDQTEMETNGDVDHNEASIEALNNNKSSASAATKVDAATASSKLDLLAGKLLESSGLLSTRFVARYIHRRRMAVRPHTTAAFGNDGEEEEYREKGHYLSALERILDIHRRTKKDIFAAHHGNDEGVGGEEALSALLGLLPCTPLASHSFSAVNNRSSSIVPAACSSMGEYWSPPFLQSANNGMTMNGLTCPLSKRQHPSPHSFYIYVGYFMVCAYNPSTFKTADNGANHPKEP